MNKYISYGEFQNHMRRYYNQSGNKVQFIEMINYLEINGMLLDERPELVMPYWNSESTTEEFNKVIDSLILTVTPMESATSTVEEGSIIPKSREVFIIRHPRYTRRDPHRHNYFEINYVVEGSCNFHFNGEDLILKSGEICVIAPGSLHDITIDDESTVYTLMIRKSTFNANFFSLLSNKDLLGHFFRTILQDDSHENYLLFFTRENKKLKSYMRNALLECHEGDTYSNNCCINWVNLIFSELLRNYSSTIQFYNYQMGTDFSLILQYIQHNYQTLTLSSLAEFFHYSEPHLSTLIRHNTGRSFTDLIKELRINDAINLLVNTNMKVSQIADQVGYNSADHFSRVFRGIYKESPLEYRKKHSQEEQFKPFQKEEQPRRPSL